MKRRWLTFLKIAIGVGLIAALFLSGKIDLSELGQVREHWPYFLVGQLFFGSAFLATIFRWKVVLHALEVPARSGDVVRLGWIGLLFSQAIPGSTGGDVVKGYYIARETPHRRAEAVLSVVLDRVIGLTALMIVGSVALFLNRDLISDHALLEAMVWALAAGVLLVVVAGALISWEGLWRRRWVTRLIERLPGRRILERLVTALWEVRGKRRLLLYSLVMSVGIHSLNITGQLFLGWSLLGSMPSVSAYFFLIPVGQLAFALPLSPGGLGVGEGAYEALFPLMGQTSGAEVAVLFRITAVLWAVPGLIFYLRGKKALEEALQAAEEDSEALETAEREPRELTTAE